MNGGGKGKEFADNLYCLLSAEIFNMDWRGEGVLGDLLMGDAFYGSLGVKYLAGQGDLEKKDSKIVTDMISRMFKLALVDC